MQRRSFVKTTILGTISVGLSGFSKKEKTHIITLSFDDGFKKSFFKTAEIYEQFGLRACLNIIASGHLSSFQSPDQWILPGLLGNFDDWNTLQRRGHEIMPHSWDHINLTQQPFEKAMALIDKCLNYFGEHLEGFIAANAVFNFAFNASTPELEKYALSKVQAVRTQGDTAVNNIPVSKTPARLGCWSAGPNNIDNWVEQQVNEFLSSSGGWLILNTHGLDDEGWGPMSANYLTGLLARLVKINYLEILPAGEVFKRRTIPD